MSKEMKAISIKEPWASMIRNGTKTIETRTWKTNYRGRILICASAKPRIRMAGLAVALVDIVDCRPMKKSDEEKACCKLYPNAYAWILENIKPTPPFPVKGTLGIYELPINLS